jgi:hypothetical protein
VILRVLKLYLRSFTISGKGILLNILEYRINVFVLKVGLYITL